MFFRIIILTSLTLLSLLSISAQEIKIKADSLFEKQKFTEAFELYDSLYQSGKTSESVLLKMAYIKEGLGDYTNSLIYLNKYYDLTNNRKAFDKMSELAEENELQGYKYSDNRLFTSIIRSNRNGIIIALIFMMLINLIVIIIKKRKGTKSIGALGMQIILSIIVLVMVNQFFFQQEAIINKDQTIVMSGPSAGAEPIMVLEKGHRVEVIVDDNIWVKIHWEENEVWVRKQQLTYFN